MVFEYLLWELGNFKNSILPLLVKFHLASFRLSWDTSNIFFLGKKCIAVFILLNCHKMISPVPKQVELSKQC